MKPLIFKIQIIEDEKELVSFELPENAEYIFQIENKEVVVSNKVDIK
jgi:hypothetical protein